MNSEKVTLILIFLIAIITTATILNYANNRVNNEKNYTGKILKLDKEFSTHKSNTSTYYYAIVKLNTGQVIDIPINILSFNTLQVNEIYDWQLSDRDLHKVPFYINLIHILSLIILIALSVLFVFCLIPEEWL